MLFIASNVLCDQLSCTTHLIAMEEAEVARQQIEEEVRKFSAFTGAQKPAADAIFILVMGMTGAGKSSFVASCTGKQVTVGHTLHSCMYL